MTHPEDRLADYVDGTLDPTERAAVDAHLATCGRCHGEVAAATGARTALASIPEVPPPLGVASAALDLANATKGTRVRRAGTEPPRWYRFAGVAAAAAAALVVLTLVLPHVGGGGGPKRAADRAEGPASALTTPGPELSGALEIQDTDYDQASLTALVATFGAAQGSAVPSAPAPAGGAATATATGTPQQTQKALACVAKAVPAEHGTLVRLIEARFEGKPAYIAVFLEGPGAGQPPDSAAVWVISTKTCSILSSGYAKR